MPTALNHVGLNRWVWYYWLYATIWTYLPLSSGFGFAQPDKRRHFYQPYDLFWIYHNNFIDSMPQFELTTTILSTILHNLNLPRQSYRPYYLFWTYHDNLIDRITKFELTTTILSTILPVLNLPRQSYRPYYQIWTYHDNLIDRITCFELTLIIL